MFSTFLPFQPKKPPPSSTQHLWITGCCFSFFFFQNDLQLFHTSSKGTVCYTLLKQKSTLQLQGQASFWILKLTLQPLIAMLMTTWEESLLNQSNILLMLPLFLETRGLSSFAVRRLCCRGCPCRLEMTASERQWSDWRLRDSPSVRQSEGWETLADRSGETGRNKRRGGGGGKPGSFVFQSGEMREVGQDKKNQKCPSGVACEWSEGIVLVDGVLRGIKGWNVLH